MSGWGLSSSSRGALRVLVQLAIPTMTEEILSTLLQYVDMAMVGRLGEAATASVSLTTTIGWLIHSLSFAVGTAVLSLTAQAFGRGDQKEMRGLSRQAFFLAVVLGLALGAVSLALAPFLPAWMGAEEEIWRDASLYFAIISLPMVFRTASIILGSAVRAVQNTRDPMLITLASNVLNAALDAVFIYGLGLGVAGAALASAVSYTAGGVGMFALWRKTAPLTWPWHSFSVSAPLLRRLARIGVPVLFTSAASCLGYIVFSALVSGMGTAVFAAHSIALSAETIFYIPGYGLRTATTALVGQAIGEKNRGKLVGCCRLSVALTVGMMVLSGIGLYLVAEPLMRLFTPSEPVIALGAAMLRLVSFIEPFFGLMVVLEGIFYGLGRTKYAFFVETGSMWGVRILFAWLAVHWWGLGLAAVWLAMMADNICKALLLSLPFASARFRRKLLPQTV